MYNKNAWEKYSEKKDLDKVFDFAEGYKEFLNNSKTERLAVKEAEKILIKSGFKLLDKKNELKAGDKVYVVNRNKNIMAFVVGKKSLLEGMRILCAHIDSPRLDLKQNPLYEDGGLAFFDTHYYGGIKKYQWVTIPLALIGVVCKKNGETVNISIGLKDTDPVFGVSDLLIHLSSEQMNTTLKKAISGEKLDVSLGSIPLFDKKKPSFTYFNGGYKKELLKYFALKSEKNKNLDAVKANVLKILKDHYDINEEDLISAEIEAVPAFPAKDYGIDKSMIAGYGQDDRSCAYASLMSIANIDANKVDYTSCVLLVDKEEIGSEGATGANSFFAENVISSLIQKVALKSKSSFCALRTILDKSKIISSDVTAASDPLYKNVDAPNNNMARFGYGVCFNKYTGHGGKSCANDADPEYIAYLRNILDKNNINYQNNELGAIDVGGGGTIAYIFAKYNADIIDAGIPLLNMHAPMEILSKVDLYETYLFYSSFLVF